MLECAAILKYKDINALLSSLGCFAGGLRSSLITLHIIINCEIVADFCEYFALGCAEEESFELVHVALQDDASVVNDLREAAADT